MSYVSGSDVSCGIKQFCGINDFNNPAKAVFSMAEETQRQALWYGMILFSTTTEYSIGEKMHRFIKELDIGPIYAIGPTKNPNTGHQIMLWVWQVQHRDLQLWKESVKWEDIENYKHNIILNKGIKWAPWLVIGFNKLIKNLSTIKLWSQSTALMAAVAFTRFLA